MQGPQVLLPIPFSYLPYLPLGRDLKSNVHAQSICRFSGEQGGGVQACNMGCEGRMGAREKLVSLRKSAHLGRAKTQLIRYDSLKQ
ncbi:mCG147144 [Mus musculus]|nr:mCG147144 [Mus musculus]